MMDDSPIHGSSGLAECRAILVNPSPTYDRISLDETSWVDVSRNWLLGADDLYTHLHGTVDWRENELFRYERWVEERRLGSSWRRGKPLPHPSLAEVTRTLQRRYGVMFEGFGMIQYRDGNDGQGFHRDTDMRWLEDTIICVLTTGQQRPWRLRPRENRHLDLPDKGATHDFSPASGDLLVMGGRCQADWEHSVPYLTREKIGTRISLQFRAVKSKGEPFMGASYRAAVTYRHGRPAPQDR